MIYTLAFVVIANRRYTDLFEWGQRTTSFNLAAEIQRRLLPEAFTCEAASFTLSAWLEPAASIAGDTFDYSLARDLLHLSITDAVGHGVHSALTATLCVSGLRNARRRGATLLEQAQAANEAIIDNTPGAATFATGILGRLDLSTGVLDVVNAGHPAPLLVRDGIAQPVALSVNRPFGVVRGCTPGRPSASSATSSSNSPAPPCPTTPVFSSSTGTAVTATCARPPRAPTSSEPALPTPIPGRPDRAAAPPGGRRRIIGSRSLDVGGHVPDVGHSEGLQKPIGRRILRRR